MNLGNKHLELAFERAVQLLTQSMPVGIDRKKPVLMHSLRVGMYLYEQNYSEAVVIGGLLHDMVKWTESPKERITDEFGQSVFEIVMANTKDRSIEDKADERRDMVKRCAEYGKDALIVKAADTLDSLIFYRSVQNDEEIEYCLSIIKLIQEYLVDEMQDPMFDRIREMK